MPICNQQRIRRFLLHELSDAETKDFEQHLSSCKECCHQLEASTAEHAWWQDVTKLLPDQQDDWLDAAPASELTTQRSRTASEEPDHGVPLNGAIRNVLQLLAPTDDPSMLGRLGTYEIAGVVGAGGMSVVLKGFDRSLNRFVAIKVLSPQLSTSGAARERFAREAQAAAAIVHENVIAIHGVDEGQGLPYLVMPYIRGDSLQKRIDRQGPLGIEESVRIAQQIATGLAAAHAKGIVHRDVKPANILLANGVERVTITDFGLAQAADDASLTRSGMIAGTPQYMSPEQAKGETIDARSDLFSLGSVLYVICTGRPPFRSETSYGVLRRITDEQPRPMRELNHRVPNWLERIVSRLHAKSADDRYNSANELAQDLEKCLAHLRQPQQQSLPDWLDTKPTTRLSRLLAALLAIVCSTLLFVTQFEYGTPGNSKASRSGQEKTSLSLESAPPTSLLEPVGAETTNSESGIAKFNSDEGPGEPSTGKLSPDEAFELEMRQAELEILSLEQELNDPFWWPTP